MTTISVTDLTNAKLDATTIAQVSMVGTTADTVTNRDGVVINTLQGQLKKLGYLPPVAYAGSIEFLVTDITKTVDRSGIVYAPLISALPFTTVDWATDEAKFYVVQSKSTDAPLTANVTVTVGAAGDYASIYAALAAVTALYTPVHVSPSSRRVTINILAGYVMAERLIFDGIDLSWITITGADAETTMTQSVMGGGLDGAIRVVNGAKAPIISQLFTMDSSGANTASGVYCSNSWVTFTSGAGIKNGRGIAVNAAQSGVIVAPSCNFSGFGAAVSCSNMSSVDVRDTNLTPTSDGISCVHGSRINANGATLGPGNIQCYDGSEVLADGMTVIEIECTKGSRVSFIGGTTSATTGIIVLTGSIVAASGSTGTLSIAANTLTAAGIIFK